VDQARVQPYDGMHVWDGVSGSVITFDWNTAGGTSQRNYNGERTIAYMTENNNLISALVSRAHELGGISLLDNSRVESIDLGSNMEHLDLSSWPVLRLSSGRTLAARLLIGADGPNSLVRSFAGINSRGWDYDRHGVVATLQLEQSDESHAWDGQGHIAYQRFLPTGPAALLPLPGGHASLVWSTTPTHAAQLKKLSPEDMAAMINAAFRLSPVDLSYMHTMTHGQSDEFDWREQHTAFERSIVPRKVSSIQSGSVASFPLRMRHADTYTGERVALVG